MQCQWVRIVHLTIKVREQQKNRQSNNPKKIVRKVTFAHI
jgi:hypothetical protein